MIRLHYSNRTDRLVAALASQLAADRAERGPLSPATVIVPHQALAAHLKLSLAQSTGLMANLSFVYLRAFLSDLVPGIRVLGAASFELLLLEILSDEATLLSPALAPVRAYLDAAGRDRLAKDLRRAQLAKELARLYDEYVLARADLLEAWKQGGAGSEALDPAVAGFERALWRELLERAGPEARTLADAFGGALRLPPRIHLFQVAVGAPTLKNVLARLGQATELEIYAINPCLEFWEDLARGRLQLRHRPELPARRQGKLLDGPDPFGLLNLADPPALRLWGRPGRETIRLYDDLTDCDFDAHFDDPLAPAGTLLERLQRDVLHRAPAEVRRAAPPGADPSLKIHACPGIRREAEIIAEEIWQCLEDFPGLRFHEIAVALPKRDEASYRAQLSAAFAETHRIPHHHLDVPLAGTSRLVEALLLLLALPYSRFTRQDLLRLVTHPVVLGRYPEASAEEWVEWCESLSLLHGADHSDHESTYIEKDLYNWDQGLWRIVLGVYAGASPEQAPIGEGDRRYLPLPLGFDRLESAASLVTLVRSLLADARFLASGQRPLAEWVELLRSMIVTYLVPENDDDERDRQRCLSALEMLAPTGPGPVLGFRIAAELFRARLAGLTHGTGQALADGVVIGPLSALHDLPFRVVFVPGLGEGRFPSSEQKSQLDLIAAERRPGDVSRKERDQYWFLGRLLATQDAVRLSYVARDGKSGDVLGPSSVLLELQYLLASDYGLGAEAIVEHHALRRWAEPPSDYAAPTTRRERQMKTLRTALEAHLDPARLPTLEELSDWPSESKEALRRRLLLHDIPPGATTVSALHLGALRQFLEDPASGWARFVLDLPDEDDDADPYARIDEHFTTIEPARTLLLRESLLLALHRGQPVEPIYREGLLRLELSGSAPTGVFLDAEARRHLEILSGWHKGFLKALGGKPRAPLPLSFGPAREQQVLAQSAPALVLSVPGAGEPTPLALRGTTEARLENPSASFVFLTASIERAPAIHRAELRGYLDQLVLAGLGLGGTTEHRTYVVFPDGLHTASFLPIEGEAARTQLAQLVGELYARPHAYRLDFSAVADLHGAQGQKAELERAVRRIRPARHELFSVRLDPPELDLALSILQERYQDFFARRRGPERR